MRNWQTLEQQEALKKYNEQILQDAQNKSKLRTEQRINSQQPLTET